MLIVILVVVLVVVGGLMPALADELRARRRDAQESARASARAKTKASQMAWARDRAQITRDTAWTDYMSDPSGWGMASIRWEQAMNCPTIAVDRKASCRERV